MWKYYNSRNQIISRTSWKIVFTQFRPKASVTILCCLNKDLQLKARLNAPVPSLTAQCSSAAVELTQVRWVFLFNSAASLSLYAGLRLWRRAGREHNEQISDSKQLMRHVRSVDVG